MDVEELWRAHWPQFASKQKIIGHEKVGHALPSLTCPFELFENMKLPHQTAELWLGWEADSIAHFHKLLPEFGQKSALSHVLAAIIVTIRRKADDHNIQLFYQIIEQYRAKIIEELPLRWLVSICDTLVDHGKNDAQKLIALSASLLVNTVKLYETERRVFTPPMPYPPKAAFNISEFVPGLSPFGVFKGDMVQNALTRLDHLAEMDIIAGDFARECVARLYSLETVFGRFLDIAAQEKPIKTPPHVQIDIRNKFDALWSNI